MPRIIHPESFTSILRTQGLPNAAWLADFTTLQAFLVGLHLVIALTLLAGNFAIFALIETILPKASKDPESPKGDDPDRAKPGSSELRQSLDKHFDRYERLRWFTYLTSSMFVLTSLVFFMWSSWPIWQMDWARAAGHKASPPSWGKASTDSSARNQDKGSLSVSIFPRPPTKPDGFAYERSRYAAVASGFVTTFATVYVMLIVFYFFVPKAELDSNSRRLWKCASEQGSTLTFAEWKEANGLTMDWFDKARLGLAVVGPLLAAPLAEFAVRILK